MQITVVYFRSICLKQYVKFLSEASLTQLDLKFDLPDESCADVVLRVLRSSNGIDKPDSKTFSQDCKRVVVHIKAPTVRLLRKMINSVMDNYESCTHVIKEFAPEHKFLDEANGEKSEEPSE